MLACQELSEVLGDQEEGHVVDVGGQAERGGVLLEDGAGAHDARVGDDQVEAAGDALDLGGHRGDGFLVGDVDRDRVGDAFTAELGRLGCRALTVQVGDVHEATGVHQAARDLRAEALGAARDEGDAAVDGALTRGGGADLEGLLAGAHDDGKLRLLQGAGADLGERAVEGDGRLGRAGGHDDRAAEGLQEEPAYLGGVTHDVSLS